MTTTKRNTKNELRKQLAERYKIRYTISQLFSYEQLQALLEALESDSPLSAAIQVLIEERNKKAAKNSQLGLNNYQLEKKLVDTRKALSYVEKQLENYKRLVREMMQDLLKFEKSEIYRGIHIILNALRET